MRRLRPFWSAYLTGVVTVIAAAMLYSVLPGPGAAYAQVPDSGAQRNEMITELRRSNDKLTEIATLLRDIRDQGRPKEKPAGR